MRFKLNRIPLRRQHQALGSAFTEDRILFPLAMHLTPGAVPTPRTVSIKLYNKLISSNPPQLQAVTSICNLSPGSPPFVLFGPYVSSSYFLFSNLANANATYLLIDLGQARQLPLWKQYDKYCLATLVQRSSLVLQATPPPISLHRVYAHLVHLLMLLV